MAQTPNTHTAAPGELESLLAQRKQLEARIAAISPSSGPHRSLSHIHHSHQRGDGLPRNQAGPGNPMGRRHLSADMNEASPNMSRSHSQQSSRSESMVRTTSKGSTSTNLGNLPFSGTMAPPLFTSTRPINPVMEAWHSQEQPLSSYTLSHQPHQVRRSEAFRGQNVELVPELSHVGEDPGAWMARTGIVTTSVSLTPSPVAPSAIAIPHHLSVDTQSDMYNSHSPTTPLSDSQSLTTATTLTGNPMSRQNSLYCENYSGGIAMMNIDSQRSFLTDNNDVDHFYPQPSPHSVSSYHVSRPFDEEQSQVLVGVGGTSSNSPFSQSFSSDEALIPLSYSGYGGEPMEKSQSTGSTSSSSSSRSKQRLQAQIALAASRNLLPKGNDGVAMSRDNSSQSQSVARLQSKDVSQYQSQDNKVAISSKPIYQRPKHDRVHCDKCDDHPDGFRGEHELRRHEDRQHKIMVKKWVCITPPNLNLQDIVKPVVPLSRCKACTQQQKKYGAYYNAAAHLRRAHFKPKAKGRSKTSKLDDAARRGGKGGGNWPTMEELKPWMKEVEEMSTELSYTMAQQEEPDDDEEDLDDHNPLIISPYPHHQLEDPFLYSSPTNNDFFNINMQLASNLEMQTHQHVLASQNTFVDYQQLVDSFAGPLLPQAFEDSFSVGLEPAVNFSYRT